MGEKGRKAVVTGANGFLGSHLCRELINHGYSVVAMHRPHSDLTLLDGVQTDLRAGDITQPESLDPIFAGADVVLHIAALFRQARYPDGVYHQVNVEGTRNVLECAIRCGVKRVVHCSTIGVHSHIPNPPADEQEPYRPADIYQETKCEGEKLALSYFRDGKIEGVVIRPAMIWGPGDKRILKLFRGIKSGKLPLIGTGRTLTHWVLVSDLAQAFRLAAEREDIGGEVFIVAGERPVSMRELYSAIAGTFGVRPPVLRVPAMPLQLLGSLTETICVPLGIEPPIYRRRVDFFTKTRAFDISKAREKLGYQPSGSFEDEVALIARWYEAHGWLNTP